MFFFQGQSYTVQSYFTMLVKEELHIFIFAYLYLLIYYISSYPFVCTWVFHSKPQAHHEHIKIYTKKIFKLDDFFLFSDLKKDNAFAAYLNHIS